MEVETAEQLRAKIQAAQARRHEEDEKTRRLLTEVEQAKERQRLRNELRIIEAGITLQRDINAYHEGCKSAIDRGTLPGYFHNPNYGGTLMGEKGKGKGKTGRDGIRGSSRRSNPGPSEVVGSTLLCSESVKQGSFEWEIKGMSWLVHALSADEHSGPFAKSAGFMVGSHKFQLVYDPDGGVVHSNQCCSLGIQHLNFCGISFRYRLYVKSADGEFSQWGDQGDECHPDWDEFGKVFGPDVEDIDDDNDNDDERRATGIFGLSHAELLQSRWVHNDTMHVKVEIQVREFMELGESVERHLKHAAIEVLPASLEQNMLSMLSSGKHCDVSFIIEGERIRAHAVVLSARSEVFERLLSCGMNESNTREVVIGDVDKSTFELLLRFLYTDNLALVQDGVASMVAAADTGGSESHGGSEGSQKIQLLQNLLAVCHKYAVLRLQSWCEGQLCEFISTDCVCSIICQAHLHEAKSLEQHCLAFIQQHMGEVVKTKGFGALSDAWPEVMLKIHIYMASLSENDASEAIQAQQEARRKRQRQEVDD